VPVAEGLVKGFVWELSGILFRVRHLCVDFNLCLAVGLGVVMISGVSMMHERGVGMARGGIITLSVPHGSTLCSNLFSTLCSTLCSGRAWQDLLQVTGQKYPFVNGACDSATTVVGWLRLGKLAFHHCKDFQLLVNWHFLKCCD
jgi:hypothetical protein